MWDAVKKLFFETARIVKVNSGKLIYQSKDTSIEVRENHKFRWLHFGDDVFQTIIDLKSPHKLLLDHMPILLKILDLIPTPKSILLLGLGGGALVHYFRYYYPDSHLTVVEINATVIDAAIKHFFVPNKSENITVINKAAENYLSETNEKFDLILMDVFIPHQLP